MTYQRLMLFKYMEDPPPNCQNCFFSTIITDGNGLQSAQIFCVMHGVFNKGESIRDSMILRPAKSEGCSREVFLKKMVEIL